MKKCLWHERVGLFGGSDSWTGIREQGRNELTRPAFRRVPACPLAFIWIPLIHVLRLVFENLEEKSALLAKDCRERAETWVKLEWSLDMRNFATTQDLCRARKREQLLINFAFALFRLPWDTYSLSSAVVASREMEGNTRFPNGRV